MNLEHEFLRLAVMKNNRLVHVKITGGTLSAKQKLSEEEKIDQIRIYSGRQFTMVDTAEAGMVCALKGLNGFEAGQGLGFERICQNHF